MLVAALALLAPACTASGPTIRLADGQRASAHGEADVAGDSATVVELGEFFFKPTVLRGTPGQRLTVTLSNQGNGLHDFAIPAQHTDANDLVAALVKLYEDNASTLTPDPLHSAFYDSHPPAAVRIASPNLLS